MATALDLLMSAKEDVNLLSEQSDICTIDAKTRIIFVPSTIVVGGVQSDKNAERIKFSCPKIVGDNLDLSKFSVRINFENVSSVDFNVSIKDQYICDDVAVDGENVTFSWLIGRNAARYMGTVRFIVCAVKTDSDSNISVEWNTTIAEVPVLEGIEIDQPQIGQEEKDVINQLLELTKNTSAEAVQNVNSAKEQAIKDIQSVSQPDTTLTIEGGLAEAKATGEAIASLKEDLVNNYNRINTLNELVHLKNLKPMFEQGNIDNSGNDVTTDFGIRTRTRYIAVNGKIIICSAKKGVCKVFLYNENYEFISVTGPKISIAILSGEAKYIRIVYYDNIDVVTPKMAYENVNVEYRDVDDIVFESNVNLLNGINILKNSIINMRYEAVGLYPNNDNIAFGLVGLPNNTIIYLKIAKGSTVYKAHSYSNENYIIEQRPTMDTNDIRIEGTLINSIDEFNIYSFKIPEGRTNVGLFFKKTDINDESRYSVNVIPKEWKKNDNEIVVDCWGDSLTQSINAQNKSYPSMLSDFLGVKTYNFGNGGETALEIAGRQGGCPLVVANNFNIGANQGSFANITLKSSYNDYEIGVTSQLLTQNYSGVNPCMIGDIKGALSNNNGTVTFTRLENGKAETIKAGEVLYPHIELPLNNHAQVIFVGQNNMQSIASNDDLIQVIKNMISFYNNNRYLVICPIQRTNVTDIIEMEKLFKKEFGNKCLCLREYLNHYGIQKAIEYGFITSASEQDIKDIANGIIPVSLRIDTVHLNYYGYYIMAKRVAELITYNKLI